MDEKNIPIDINTNKLLDWLISRRHVNKNWQEKILKIREKIKNAIQDMPEHKEIVELLTGQHINYFHCKKIVEILKETEADTKNLFGRYGSQRMKDWQDIVNCYQKDNVYLAEAAQILIRNVNYEIPSLKKQITRFEQSQVESERKIKELSKNEANTLKEFNASCKQLGIEGTNISKNEFMQLPKELPELYEKIANQFKIIKPAIELYDEFLKFHSVNSDYMSTVPTLRFLVENGNVTCYEFFYGQKPTIIQQTELEEEKEVTPTSDDGEIDFGDSSIDFGDSNGDSTEEFEIVTLEESGIVVESAPSTNNEDTQDNVIIAKGTEALTILDNPETRRGIMNDLMELDSFLKLRLMEMTSDGNFTFITFLPDAPGIVQMQTVESVETLRYSISICLNEFGDKHLQHLHNIKHSSKYVNTLIDNLNHKLNSIEKFRKERLAEETKIENMSEEIKSIKPVIDLFVEKTKELQKDIQADISKKYKGRVVNIVGGVNMI